MATAAAAARTYGSAALRGLQFQMQEGRTATIRPRRKQWQDGRRWRASAAGRRRGIGGKSRAAQSPFEVQLPALVSLLLVAVVAVGSFMSVSALWVKYAADLPDARSIALQTLPQDSIVYDSTGGIVLADLHKEGYRHYEQRLADMGALLPAATIAIEDAKFYHEPGIDVGAIVRAAWVDYRKHGAVQGASTITQQLVKLRLLGNQPTIDRKAREAILALQVEQAFNKNQILEMYLNTAFYGNNAYGTKAAAQSYFHTETAKLTLGQASMLAGIPQNPSFNNPLVNWAGAKRRQRDVLNAMVRQKEITRVEAELAFAEDLTEPTHMFRDANVILAPGFAAFVLDELRARYGAQAPYRDGFRVTTTLNWAMQQKAQQLIADNVVRFQSRGFNVRQGAAVGVDPRTGDILTMVGSANAIDKGGQYNFAVWPPRNPGSSMKMFNYTAAIESGKYTMVTPIADTPITFPKQPYSTEPPYQPQNYDKSLHGTCQLQACFLNSYNIPAVKVEVSIGVPLVAAMARKMGAPPWTYHVDTGLSTNDDPIDGYGPALTLGGYGETPLQMAQGAAVIASGGILRPVHGIRSMTNPDGVPIFKADPNDKAKQVLDPKVAFIMAQIMSDDDNRQPTFGRRGNLTLPDRRVASKTGTTDDYRDGWTVGFTPALASAVWFGNPDYTVMGGKGVEASEVAAPVWHDYMQYSTTEALKEPGNEWFGEPDGLQHFNVNGKLQWFLPGTSPSTPAPPLPPGIIVPTPKPSPTPAPPAAPPATPPPGQGQNPPPPTPKP